MQILLQSTLLFEFSLWQWQYNYLSFLKNPQLTSNLKLVYEDELQRALEEDGQRTSVYISPQTFYGDGV